MKSIIKQKVKGGYTVDISAFLPASVSHVRRDQPLQAGDVVDVSIEHIEGEKIVLSRKKFIEERSSDLLATLKSGDILDGEIVNKCDFGLFVNIGPFDILTHKNDHHPEKFFGYEVGDLVKIKILEIRDDKKVCGKLLNKILAAGERCENDS